MGPMAMGNEGAGSRFAADGAFYYSVRTNGVYCRPSCGARLARQRERLGVRGGHAFTCGWSGAWSRGSAGTLLLRASGSARLDDSTLRIRAPRVTRGSWTVLRPGLRRTGRVFLIRWTTREEGDRYPQPISRSTLHHRRVRGALFLWDDNRPGCGVITREPRSRHALQRKLPLRQGRL
jgi:hypothetical protein